MAIRSNFIEKKLKIIKVKNIQYKTNLEIENNDEFRIKRNVDIKRINIDDDVRIAYTNVNTSYCSIKK